MYQFLLYLMILSFNFLLSYPYDSYFTANIEHQYNVLNQQNNSYGFTGTFLAQSPFIIHQKNVNLEKATKMYLHLGQKFFDGDINSFEKSIKKAIQNGTINNVKVKDALTYQVICYLVKTGQTDDGKVRPYKNHAWMQQHDLKQASASEQVMINYFVARVSQQHNDTTVELVQAGLKAWSKAQYATDKQERRVAKDLYQGCYHALKKNTQIQNFACSALPVKNEQMQKLLDDYAMQLDGLGLKSSMQNSTYGHKLEKRKHALQNTLQDHKKISVNHIHKITNNALGFMYVSHINYATFNNINCNEFQHNITQEIIEIINVLGDLAYKNFCQPIATRYMEYACNLAVSAQQFNQLSYIEQAVALVDLTDFFVCYGKYTFDNSWYDQKICEIELGVIDGTIKALVGWKNFVEDLCEKPAETIGQLAHDCYVMARCLYSIAATIGPIPFQYLDDLTLDMKDYLNSLQNKDKTLPSRMMQRAQENLQVLSHGSQAMFDAGQIIVENMIERPLRENIADITQLTVDGMISSKAVECLLWLSQFVGRQCIQTGTVMQQLLPFDILDSSVSYIQTSTGELLAVAESTGETISAAVGSAAQVIVDIGTPIFKFGPQAKLLTDKIKEITKSDPIAIEQFNKSLEPFLRTDKILNIERLRSIEGIDQIDKFKQYTNNFTNLEKLTEEEILYLNLCNWLEPQARAINAELKAVGGLKFMDPITQTEVMIEKLDLFHSLLGEMKPGNLKECVSGGHLLIPALRVATLEIGEITTFADAFLDMFIRVKSNKKYNSYFPMGTSVRKSVDMIKQVVQDCKKVKITENTGFVIKLNIKSKQNTCFQFNIKDKIARFHPLHPSLFDK